MKKHKRYHNQIKDDKQKEYDEMESSQADMTALPPASLCGSKSDTDAGRANQGGSGGVHSEEV